MKNQNTERRKPSFTKRIGGKCRLIETRNEQNNDHTRIMAIYKTRNTGTGNGMRGMRGMSIPGNAQEDSGECSRRFRGMFKKILGNVRKDSGECSKSFQGMFKKIPGNVQEDSGECSRGLRGMFEKIPGNVGKDSRECSKRLGDLYCN